MARVRLGEVATERRETYKGSKSGYPVIGLEHLISENINLSMWDEAGVNTFTKMFHKGDVLFGRRRAYLKKAVIAPFDGICSGDITVIVARPDHILPELLPFVIQNDEFFDFAVGRSEGSLSPRVKWEYLREYEFDLPDMAEQRKLARVLWAVNDTIEAYRRLMGATEELVRGQFVEMFGGINSEGIYPRKQWADVLTIINGKDYKKVADPDGLYPVYGSGGIMGRANSYLCPENSIVMGRKGTIDKPFVVTEKFWNVDTTFGVVPNEGVLHYLYLFWYCKQLDFRRLNKATTLPSTTRKDLLQLWINVPPYELQQKFADFVYQADKSKSALQRTLTAARNISRKIISENLG